MGNQPARPELPRPCQKQACEIQACLKRNDFDSKKCLDTIRMYDACLARVEMEKLDIVSVSKEN